MVEIYKMSETGVPMAPLNNDVSTEIKYNKMKIKRRKKPDSHAQHC